MEEISIIESEIIGGILWPLGVIQQTVIAGCLIHRQEGLVDMMWLPDDPIIMNGLYKGIIWPVKIRITKQEAVNICRKKYRIELRESKGGLVSDVILDAYIDAGRNYRNATSEKSKEADDETGELNLKNPIDAWCAMYLKCKACPRKEKCDVYLAKLKTNVSQAVSGLRGVMLKTKLNEDLVTERILTEVKVESPIEWQQKLEPGELE